MNTNPIINQNEDLAAACIRVKISCVLKNILLFEHDQFMGNHL